MNGSVAADFEPDRHAQAQTVQTPVQTSRDKTADLQGRPNPVCASTPEPSNSTPYAPPEVAPYCWTVREGSLDGRVIMREYVYEVPDKEPVEGQELYLSNGSGPWRVILREQVPDLHRSPYNILVVERVY
jgi:hypothetical protein